MNRLGKTKKQKTKKSVFEEDLEEAWFDGDFVDYVVIFISYCGTCWDGWTKNKLNFVNGFMSKV